MPATNAELEADLNLVHHILEGVQHRLVQLEARLPIAHSGYGVTKEVGETETIYHVHMLDRYGREAVVTFTVQNEGVT